MKRFMMSTSFLLAGCSPEMAGDGWDNWFDEGEWMRESSHANVIKEFGFVSEVDGEVVGFDLDGEDTVESDSVCGFGDLPSPDGVEGIDNQLGRMWGLIEGLVGEQVKELLQGSINEGRFLMVLELEGADDLQNGDGLTVHLSAGSGQPLIGTQDRIAPDQTVYIEPDARTSTVVDVVLQDGVLEAGPMDFVLPINVLEADFPMQVVDGRVRLTIDEEGNFSGLIGGLIDVDATLEELLATDAMAEVKAVEPIFRANTDVADGDGNCRYMSSAFEFRGVRAFAVQRGAQEE